MDQLELFEPVTTGTPPINYIPSTSDKRVVNNVMRHEYRVLDTHEKAQMKAIKDLGEEFIVLIQALTSSRETSLAITKIEEAVMWAVKAVTK